MKDSRSTKKVALIFGGRSSEHEVSVRSAKNVAAALDKNLFQALLVGISKNGTWFLFESESAFEKITSILDQDLPSSARPIALVSKNGIPQIIDLENQKSFLVDIAFPILHGTFGEDGCIQGLFKMANLPFVGCDVLSSAAGMDKEVMKRLFTEANIPNARYVTLRSHETLNFDQIQKTLGLPFFIKPANAGSSVGVHKIKSAGDFSISIKDAFLYDHKVIAEEFIKGRELECSVMGLNQSPEASLPGEVVPTHEFYSYEAKYLDENGAVLKIPAELTTEQIARVQELAKKTYKIMDCNGLTRVDFFLRENGDLFVNEINTIPGFTKISMYPKMWEASGISYRDLITKLISIGFQKHLSESALKRDFL